MSKNFILLFIFCVAACTPKSDSPHDLLVQKCTNSGYKKEEFALCVRQIDRAKQRQSQIDARHQEAQKVESDRAMQRIRQEQLQGYLQYKAQQQELIRWSKAYEMRQRCATDPLLGKSYEDCIKKYVKD